MGLKGCVAVKGFIPRNGNRQKGKILANLTTKVLVFLLNELNFFIWFVRIRKCNQVLQKVRLLKHERLG